jgi:iron complex outermembrane receptor protein
VVSSYFDSRVDSFKVRGGDAVQYLDGLQRGYGVYNTTKAEPYTLERVELLRGPSSVLYGQGGVGGVLNLVSKRPQAETQREVQLQFGNHNRKQIAADFTGALDPEGKWLYRLVTVGRDSGTQVDHVADDRIVVAPSLTWRPSTDTSLTLQALYQKDKSGSLIGFFPWQGTLLPSLYGQIPTSAFAGEPGFDRYDSRNTSIGYLFSHRFNDTWTFRQNLRSTESKVWYNTSYTSFTANRLTGRLARPVFNADQRTIERDLSSDINGGKMVLLDNQAEARFKTGEVEHTLLVGADFQRNTTSKLSGRGRAGAIDIYAPVYGNYTPPTSYTRSPEVVQKQVGLYVQDQVKYGRWIGLLGLRHDKATTDTEGRPAAAADDKANTKRAGLVYLADGGWAPYLSYAESFLPLGGVDTHNTPFKPQRGKQWEAGVKWEPAGERTSFMAALYDLRDTNRKTTDPANPLNSVQLGEVHVKGLELEYKGSIAREWDWIASYAYTDARVSRSNGSDLGKRISGVPKHTASAWLTRRFSIGGVTGFTVGGGVRYLGESWDGMDGIRTPSATLFDAMLAWDNGPLRPVAQCGQPGGQGADHDLPGAWRLLLRSAPDCDCQRHLSLLRLCLLVFGRCCWSGRRPRPRRRCALLRECPPLRSSFISLRRAHHRRERYEEQSLIGCKPAACPRAIDIGCSRSEIKEERSGGHSRRGVPRCQSHAPRMNPHHNSHLHGPSKS